MAKIDHFKMPKPVNISGRISSLTNSFVNGVIPVIEPTEDEVKDALRDLGMEDGIVCAYCGGRYTEWDHFYPLVKGKKPSGNISEINNLVPCCSVCNSSKGNQDWRVFMNRKPENGSDDWQERMNLLERYDERKRIIITEADFIRICGEKWTEHWKHLDQLVQQVKEYQLLSDEIRQDLKNEYVRREGKRAETVSSPSKELSLVNDVKIGKYIKHTVWPILENLTTSEVDMLQNKEYSLKTFGMSKYTILSKERDPARYYAQPIMIRGREYFVCSQWTEKHWDKLRVWVNAHLSS